MYSSFLAATLRSFYTRRAAECSIQLNAAGAEFGECVATSRFSTTFLGGSFWGWGSALPLHPLPTLGVVEQPLSLGAAVSWSERLSVRSGVLGEFGSANPQTRPTSKELLRVCCLKAELKKQGINEMFGIGSKLHSLPSELFQQAVFNLPRNCREALHWQGGRAPSHVPISSR